MLRLSVLVLVLANCAYFAWSQGLLAPLGLAPAVQNEPQRLGAQMRPDAMRLLSADETRQWERNSNTSSTTASAQAAPAAECLQAGLFNEQQTAELRAGLETALPAGSWQLESSVEPARWIVYMGKYTSEDALAKKRSELRQLGVNFRAVNNDALAPGLALASFAEQADAEKELARIATKGVRTARVALERPEARGQILKLAAADGALRARLEPLAPLLAGKALQACR